MQVLINSGAEDWLRDDESGVSTLKRDLNVTVRRQDQEERQTLDEPWATRLAHAPALVRVFELWYGASFVRRYFFASVDGNRASLPFPKSRDDLTITRDKLAIAIAVNLDADRLHDYMRRANIGVAD